MIPFSGSSCTVPDFLRTKCRRPESLYGMGGTKGCLSEILSPLPFSTMYCGTQGLPSSGFQERPEEPAKYIHELPKLQAPELATSAVNCGNWLAQVRQIMVGLSPTASTWRGVVEASASAQYQRWLLADPLDRLMLDPSGVIADFDSFRYQRVESRSVSLILAAIPAHTREEAVSNRWLTSASLVFRIQCLCQPGGSSERSMLLS